MSTGNVNHISPWNVWSGKAQNPNPNRDATEPQIRKLSNQGYEKSLIKLFEEGYDIEVKTSLRAYPTIKLESTITQQAI